jgi:hypothetical protein
LGCPTCDIHSTGFYRSRQISAEIQSSRLIAALPDPAPISPRSGAICKGSADRA